MWLILIKNFNRLTDLVFIFFSSIYYLPCLELQQWQTETHEKQEVFRDMDDELKTARAISERMFKVHNERDFDLDWHKERADQLSERWLNIHSQIDNRLVPNICLRKTSSCVCKTWTDLKNSPGFGTWTVSVNPCSTTETRTEVWMNGSEKWKRRSSRRKKTNQKTAKLWLSCWTNRRLEVKSCHICCHRYRAYPIDLWNSIYLPFLLSGPGCWNWTKAEQHWWMSEALRAVLLLHQGELIYFPLNYVITWKWIKRNLYVLHSDDRNNFKPANPLFRTMNCSWWPTEPWLTPNTNPRWRNGGCRAPLTPFSKR